MSTYDPLQKHRRLWNNSTNILHESLVGTVMNHPNLIYLNNCNAVIRRDYDVFNKKVKIIGGGVIIDGLTYAGFVGPGMLTAAVHGLQGNISSVPTTNSILEVINYIQTNQKELNGILLVIHDCIEYYFNFLLAKEKAEEMGIPIKMILVRDQYCSKLNQKALSPRSPSGLLFFYKIAGAMSEEGKTLDEIYNTCNEIIENEIIFSVGIYIVHSSSDEVAKVEITRGDRLSDRDIKCLSIANLSAKNLIENLINDIINVNNLQKSTHGTELAIILDHFGGFSEIEVNIIIKELIQQLNKFQLKIEFIYTGAFHTSLEMNGFHLSILNLSRYSQFLNYLNAPTLAFSWSKTICKPMVLQTDIECKHFVQEDNKSHKNVDNNKISLDEKKVETDVFLTAIEYACEALIACAAKIDILDTPSINKKYEKCGTRLAKIAEVIKTEISRKKFIGLCLSTIIFQIALIFEENIEDPQAELYSLFFKSLGKAIENQKYLKTINWIDAFVTAIDSVNKIVKGTKFSSTLFAAKAGFYHAYTIENNVSVIHALEQAVIAAQKQTSHILLDSRKKAVFNDKNYGFSELAGAHAIGVWMRGAFEGIKLKYLNQMPPNKSMFNDVIIDISKTPREPQ